MHKIAVGKAIGTGWRKFMERPWYFIGITLAVGVLFAATANNAFMTALAAVLYGGYLVALLSHYDGRRIMFDDLFSVEVRRWVWFAFVVIIKGFLIFLGFLLFIIPGIYLALRWMFAELLVLDKGMRPIEAMRESRRLTYGNMWRLFWFSVVAMLVMLLGLIVLIVGVIPAAIVVTFAVIHLYRTLSAPQPEAPQRPA